MGASQSSQSSQSHQELAQEVSLVTPKEDTCRTVPREDKCSMCIKEFTCAFVYRTKCCNKTLCNVCSNTWRANWHGLWTSQRDVITLRTCTLCHYAICGCCKDLVQTPFEPLIKKLYHIYKEILERYHPDHLDKYLQNSPCVPVISSDNTWFGLRKKTWPGTITSQTFCLVAIKFNSPLENDTPIVIAYGDNISIQYGMAKKGDTLFKMTKPDLLGRPYMQRFFPNLPDCELYVTDLYIRDTFSLLSFGQYKNDVLQYKKIVEEDV